MGTRTPNQRREALERQFRALGKERLAQVRSAWGAVSTHPDDEVAMSELHRILHMLKGDAKLVGLAEPGRLIRRMEELLLQQSQALLVEAERQAFCALIDDSVGALAHWLGESPEPQEATVLAELSARLDAELYRLAHGARGGAGRARVLVVDDSYLVRSGLTAMLGALGYEVQVAQDGLDALSAIESSCPDAVLTDVDMPRLGGRGLLQKLRADERYKTLPVLVVSHSIPADELRGVLGEGADGVLSKGEVDESNLSRELSRVLKRSG